MRTTTVVTDEIRFGDNDTLAGLVANLVNADRLMIMTDQDGIFDKILAATRTLYYSMSHRQRILSWIKSLEMAGDGVEAAWLLKFMRLESRRVAVPIPLSVQATEPIF